MRVILYVPQVGLLLLSFLKYVRCDCDWNATIKDSQQLPQNYLRNNNCPLLSPTIKILNYNRFNNSKFTKYAIFSQDDTNKTLEIPTESGIITLECSSTQPVTWNIQGYLKSELINTVVLKRNSLEHNNTAYCYKALISFNTSLGDLGYTISCKHVYQQEGGDPSQKFLHFYGKRSAGVDEEEPVYTCYTNTSTERKSRQLSFDNMIAGSDSAGPKRSNHLKINLQYYDDKKIYPYFECSSNSKTLSNSETSSHLTSAEQSDESGEFSAPSLSVSMALIKCSNPVHCKLVTRFLDTKNEIDVRGDYLLYGRETNVLSIPGSYTSGVVLCRTNDKTKYQYVQFYRSVNKHQNKILLYDDHNLDSSQHSEIEPSSVMEIVPPSINDSKNSETPGMPIKCILSYFLFARGSNWRLEYSNGPPNILNSPENEKHYINMKSELVSHVTDNPKEIKSITCRAPLWNSDKWVSLKYQVSRPEIIRSSKNLDLYDTDTDTNITLFCEAVGSPLPTIAWYKDGQAIDKRFYNETHDKGSASTTYFLHFNRTPVNLPAIAGDYSCKATNYFGTTPTGRKLTIKVTPNPLLQFVAYSLGSIFFITIITLSIYLYNFWTQSIIDKKKIQELMKNFYEGIPLPTQQDNNDNSSSDTPSNNDQSPDTDTGKGLAFSLVYDKEKYELNPEDLEVEEENPSKKLGSGNYGIVYEGCLKTSQSLPMEPVAVKMLKEWNLANVEDLLAELKLLIYVNEGQHENIVKLIGAITRHCNEKIQIVMEFCKEGSLQKYLERNKATFYDEFERNPSVSQNPGQIPPYVTIGTRITTSDLIRWSLQLARGMKYLDSKKIIHGDLAARNILLTSSRDVKIIDFGLAKKLKDGQSRYVKKPESQYFTKSLPVDRLPPEYLRDEIFSTQSDVWAFGITLWEIFSLGEEPYANFPKEWAYFQKELSNGYRLPRPEYASPQIYSIMKECWDENPDNRPTFENLVNFFEHLSVPANQQGQPTTTTTQTESESRVRCLSFNTYN